MDSSTVDIILARPDIWVALADDEPEGGFVVRRLERWTCTCAADDTPCRHIRAARSLISHAAQVVRAVKTQQTTTTEKPAISGVKQSARTRRKAAANAEVASAVELYASISEAIDDEVNGQFVVMPPKRLARAVKVSDQSARRIAAKAVAA